MQRISPPADISPADFFLRWVPDAVAQDAGRRAKLRETTATIEFSLSGAGGGVFALRIEQGYVRGQVGPGLNPDLRVELDVSSWRSLNSGALSAPEALLRRQLRFTGDVLLGLKLHLILG